MMVMMLCIIFLVSPIRGGNFFGFAACCVADNGALKRYPSSWGNKANWWSSIYTRNKIDCKNNTLRWSNRLESF